MQKLLQAIRTALPPASWSRGVNLCREGRVAFAAPTALGASEVEAQVLPPQGGSAATVLLYPDDAEWDCDCDVAAKMDACAHAAAAAIALGQARAGKLPEPAPQNQPLRLRYAFARTGAGLALQRLLVAPATSQTGDPEAVRPEVLAIPLAVRQRQPGAPVLSQPSDVAVDSLLAGRRIDGALGTALLQRVLAALVDAEGVQLDGEPVQVGEASLSMQVRAQNRPGGGALVQGVPPAGLSETFANGAGRFGRTLRSLCAVQLSARDQEALRSGQVFAPSEMPALLGEVLPRLSRLMPVDRQGLGDVKTVAAQVRVHFFVEGPADAASQAEGARVLAQLVYVAPAARPARGGQQAPTVDIVGRVTNDRLRAEGARVPLRDAAAELRVVEALHQALGLLPGHPRSIVGAADLPFVQRLLGFAKQHHASMDDAAFALRGWRVHPQLQPAWLAEPGAGLDASGPDPFDLRLVVGSDGYAPEAAYAHAEQGDAAWDALGFAAEGGTFGESGGAGGSGGAGRGAGASVDLATALAAHARGERYVALPGGGFAPLPGPLLASHAEPLQAFLLAREAARQQKQGEAASLGGRAGGPLPGWVLASLGEVGERLGVKVPAAARQAHAALAAPAASDPAAAAAQAIVPPSGVELRPYQRAGIAWLRARRSQGIGALLADDMGLGKTLQTLLALPPPAEGRTLVVAPTSVLTNWAEEAARFCPERRVATFHGPQRSLASCVQADLVLTSYGVLRLDGEALAAQGFAAMVLDEAHVIKRAGTQVARAALQVGSTVAFRLALTGTPLENRSEELWSLMHFLNPGVLGSEEDFARTYARPLANNEAGAADRLRARVAPVLLRRLKREVARDLPPRTDVVLRSELTPAERTVYQALLQATRKEVVEKLEAGASVMAALEALLRLRQAACHTGLLPGHGYVPSSSKLDLLLETLQQGLDEGHRALVFSQWTGLLDRVEPLLRQNNVDFLRLDGSTRDRGHVVQQFSKPSGPPVLLMSLKAGGVGLNLTAADHVFLLDPWWNPAAEDQAADRANRIGQTRPVLVHRLVSNNTVEEGILALQQSKRALAQAALEQRQGDSAAEVAASFTRADLVALLNG